MGDVLPLEGDASARRRFQAQQAERQRRLAAAALPNQRQDLSPAQLERDPVDGVDMFRRGALQQTAPHRKEDLQILDDHHRRLGHPPSTR